MKTEIRIPTVGESINEATISAWLKKNGDTVKTGEVLLSLETDKANVEVVAEANGVLQVKEDAGKTLAIGSVVGFLETGARSSMTKPEETDEVTKKIILVAPPPPSSKQARPAEAPSAAKMNGASFDIRVPTVGESITEATIAAWTKKNGDLVHRDEIILSLETDKATVDVVAEATGVLETTEEAGAIVKIGAIVGRIRSNGDVPRVAAPQAAQAQPARSAEPSAEISLSPAVRRVVSERGIDPTQIAGTGKGGRITKTDAEEFSLPSSPTPRLPAEAPTMSVAPVAAPAPKVLKAPQQGAETSKSRQRRVKMTTIRKRIAERLVHAQATAAILTTFNEVNMGAVMAIRAKYKEAFKERYGVGLGFMGLFVKACIEALRAYPEVNAFIDGDEIVYNDSFNIGVAIGAPKGLIVPVLHHAENMSLSEVELKIKEYAEKAKAGKIQIEDLSGGTFTISNGGTYGSLMSTPILNPPQSGILGMHKIQDRPIAVNGKVEIHPMMYLALSYDHRIIDGEGAVKFLVKVKEALEDPNRILLEI